MTSRRRVGIPACLLAIFALLSGCTLFATPEPFVLTAVMSSEPSEISAAVLDFADADREIGVDFVSDFGVLLNGRNVEVGLTTLASGTEVRVEARRGHEEVAERLMRYLRLRFP